MSVEKRPDETQTAFLLRTLRAEALEEAAKIVERIGLEIGGAIQPDRTAAAIRAAK